MTDLSSANVASTERRALGPRALSRSASLAVDISIASGVALILGLVRLGAPSVWFDEAYTAEATGRSPAWWLANDQYHFLYDGLLALWAAVAGTSEWALRAPSVLGAMIAAALMVVLGRKLFDRWVALSSGVLLAASPFVVKWSQQARSYTLLLALSLVATLVLIRALDRGTRSSWALYGLVYAAVVVGHAVAGILLAPAHLVLIAQRRERVLPHGPLAAVIVLAIAVPWAATVAMRSTGQGAGMAWLQPPSATVVVQAVADVSGAAGLGVALAALGLVLLWRTGRLDLAVWLGAWAAAPFALALVMTAVTPVFLDRYLIVAAPAFALLAGVAIVGAGRRFGPLLAGAAVLVSAIALVQWHSTDAGNWRGEDWRSAVAALRSESGATDVVVVPWWAHLGAEYYGASTTSAATEDSVWVLTWSETGHRLPRAERAPLGFGDHVLVEREDFGTRVSLQHWVRRG
jgi:mannosyltransferase